MLHVWNICQHFPHKSYAGFRFGSDQGRGLSTQQFALDGATGIRSARTDQGTAEGLGIYIKHAGSNTHTHNYIKKYIHNFIYIYM